MSDGTKIEWTDATVNAVNGCSVLSPGCTNCYAMRLAGSRLKHHPSREGLTVDSKDGPVWNGTVRLHEPALLQPLRWRRPRRIFWNAHGDLFHDAVPDEWIDRVFAVMALTPQHTHQVLTKRSARMRAYLNNFGRIGDAIMAFRKTDIAIRHGLGPNAIGPLPHVRPGAAWFPFANIWLGVSVEDQTRADERIPDLLATPAAVRFLSCEPLLGPIDLGQLQEGLPVNAWLTWLDALDWVIVGGESGPGSRPMHPAWARLLRDQCEATGVPFFFKQWGEWVAEDQSPEDCTLPSSSWSPWGQVGGGGDQTAVWKLGKKAAGRQLDGVTHDGFPA